MTVYTRTYTYDICVYLTSTTLTPHKIHIFYTHTQIRAHLYTYSYLTPAQKTSRVVS